MVREVAGVDDEATRPTSPSQRLRELIDRVCVPGTDAHTVDRFQALVGLAEPRRDESAFVNDVRSGFLALMEGLSRASGRSRCCSRTRTRCGRRCST